MSVRPPNRTFLPFLAWCFTINASACQSAAGHPAYTPVMSLNSVVTWQPELRLDSISQPLVLPTLAFLPDHGMLVTDVRTGQIVRYTPRGTAVRSFGRAGSGPGEFTGLAASIPLRDGRVLALDRGGSLVIFDSLGRPAFTKRTSLLPIYDAALINDSLLAIAGRIAGDTSSPLLHVWNLRRDTLTRSFFRPPPHDPKLGDAYEAFGSADVAVHGDTLAAIFALSDTVYQFGTTGRALGKLPLGSRFYRPMDASPPTDPKGFGDWRQSFSRLSQIFTGPDHTYFVTYYDLDLAEPQWRLIRISSTGKPLYEIRDTSRLLGVSGRTLFFIHPDPFMTYTWRIASLRS